jgi:peptidoglycan/LPS O-acetylase OafA/YrhL
MKYRREIDGLRAVAVLPVILFHAGFSVFSGGYVGVDVFFVISGYLITSILISELEQGTFSIARFYERRARRILPALFFVMLVCMPFAYMWMMPSQLDEFAQSIFAVVFFLSNWLFWEETGYFGTAAELKPLLHTWSLAVEEQYYLLFPVFMLALWRFGRSWVFVCVSGIALFSLILSEWGWRNEPDINFFFTFSRFWELLAGSICAFLTVVKKLKSSNMLSSFGLVAIVFAIFSYDSSTPFPSVYALVPVIGTSLIILFGRQGTWVAKLLSVRGLVGIGLISYSAYLWHQPLFAFARIRSLAEPNHVVMGGLAVTALLLAWGTWRWIERPFRRPDNSLLATRGQVFAASGFVGAIFAASGFAGHYTGGLATRVEIGDAANSDLTVRKFVNSCFDLEHQAVVDELAWFCEEGKVEDFSATVAVVGDSHALSYFGPLSEWGSNNRVRFLFNGISGCPPLVNTFILRSGRLRDDCAARNQKIFTEQALKGVDVVVLNARWTYYGYGDSSGSVRHIGTSYDVEKNRDVSYRVFLSQLLATLQILKELRLPVVFVHQQPVQLVEPLAVFGRAALFEEDLDLVSSAVSVKIDQHIEDYTTLQEDIGKIIHRLDSGMATEIDVAPLLCSPICQVAEGGRAIYLDKDHLSNFGAGIVLPMIVQKLEVMLRE